MPNITQNSQKSEFLPVLCMETPFDHLWHFGVITMAEAWMDRPVVIGCLILALDSFLSCGIFLSHFHGTNHIWIIRIWMALRLLQILWIKLFAIAQKYLEPVKGQGIILFSQLSTVKGCFDTTYWSWKIKKA